MGKPIYDWRQGNCAEHLMATACVGPCDGDPLKRAVLTWRGPASRGEARENALRAARIAWRVGSTLTGVDPRELPEHLAFDRSVVDDTDGAIPTIWLDNEMTQRLKEGEGDWPPASVQISQVDVDRAAMAVLRAAAARAKLPKKGSVALAYGTEADLPGGPSVGEGDSLKVAIAIEEDGWTSHVGVDGSIADAITAIAVARHLCREDVDNAIGTVVIEIPESATLTAIFPQSLRDEAPGHARAAAAFLETVGLPDVARDFLEDHGR